jgi:hypothetical protein
MTLAVKICLLSAGSFLLVGLLTRTLPPMVMSVFMGTLIAAEVGGTAVLLSGFVRSVLSRLERSGHTSSKSYPRSARRNDAFEPARKHACFTESAYRSVHENDLELTHACR